MKNLIIIKTNPGPYNFGALNFEFTTNNNKYVSWSFSEIFFRPSKNYDNRLQTIQQNFYFNVNQFTGFKMSYQEVKEFLNLVNIELNKTFNINF